MRTLRRGLKEKVEKARLDIEGRTRNHIANFALTPPDLTEIAKLMDNPRFRGKELGRKRDDAMESPAAIGKAEEEALEEGAGGRN